MANQFEIMADSIELRMSVTSIKRVDPYVKDILGSATHVALYKFNTAANEWEKTETEGALFIYSRNGEPFHSIMVMNRLNTNNLIEPIVKEFDFQMQAPFLLYKNSKSKIFGIWFFNREECIRITFQIESIMETLQDNLSDKSKKKENGIDIFSMLSKAQEDFNKTPTKQDSQAPNFSSTPRGVVDVTSQSVMDFFAKATNSKSTTKPNVPGAPSEQNVLQRLMSNPAHSVEHIEKQQRATTPQEVQAAPHSNSDRRSVPITFPSTSGSTDKHNGVSFHVNSPRANQNTSSPLGFLLQNSQAKLADDSASNLGTSPFASFLDNAQKPQFMTPMMFTSLSNNNNSTKENISFQPTASVPVEEEDKLEQVDLLTEKQLAQALIHLLKNNSDFTKQIHEAYVSSIMERVNVSKVNKSLI